MAKRMDPNEQSYHDRVVADLMHEYKYYPSGSRVIINPSSEHNKDINGYYPDVVCFDPSTNMTYVICEVETENSVNEQETQQWFKFAQLHTTFYLFVPDTCYSNALGLIKNHNIKAIVNPYHYTGGVLIVP